MSTGSTMSGSAANSSIRKPGSNSNVARASRGPYGGPSLWHPHAAAASTTEGPSRRVRSGDVHFTACPPAAAASSGRLPSPTSERTPAAMPLRPQSCHTAAVLPSHLRPGCVWQWKALCRCGLRHRSRLTMLRVGNCEAEEPGLGPTERLSRQPSATAISGRYRTRGESSIGID